MHASSVFLCAIAWVSAWSQPAIADEDLQRLVAKKAAVISALHRKAQKSLVNAAQDGAFGDYATARAAGHDGEPHDHLRNKVDEISLTVQSRFAVEEMCLISPDGPELARIVGNQIASDLSPDESAAVFFEAGFAQKQRTAYISPLYMSPDADKWVVAYVTPIASEGETKAILHYEHGLNVYQAAMNKGVIGNARTLLAINEAGLIVSDNRRAVDAIKRDDSEDPVHYFEKFELASKDLAEVMNEVTAAGKLSGADGRDYRVAFKKVQRWILLAFEAS